MKALKLSLTYDPPQIGLLYKRHPNEKKKQVYVIQLHGLIFLGDSEKITEILFHKHSEYLNPKVVNPTQVKRFVDKLLEYLQKQLADYEKQEQMIMDYQKRIVSVLIWFFWCSSSYFDLIHRFLTDFFGKSIWLKFFFQFFDFFHKFFQFFSNFWKIWLFWKTGEDDLLDEDEDADFDPQSGDIDDLLEDM